MTELIERGVRVELLGEQLEEVRKMLGAGYMVVEVVPWFNAPEYRIFTVADFDDVPAIIGVESFPPSLFVEVSRRRWEELSRQQRMAVVRRVGRDLDLARYNGARFTDESGTVVGEWIRGVGDFVYDQ